MADLNEFLARLKGAGDQVDKIKQRTMSRIVITVEAESKRKTPVRTGTLRRSITHRVERSGDRGVVGTNIKYAKYVHEGTSRMRARPFLDQGLAASRDSIKRFTDKMGAEILALLAD